MLAFAELCESIAATTKKSAKVALLAEYFRAHDLEESRAAAVLLSGRAFPAHEESTLNVGGALLWRAVADISGAHDRELSSAYRNHGDLGSAAAEVLKGRKHSAKLPAVSLMEFQQTLRTIAAARGPAFKTEIIVAMMRRLSADEIKYALKVIMGDLRIGLRESLVEDGIAKAFGTKADDVRRANMLRGDIGETLQLAAQGGLAEARMAMFHPIAVMLASPAENAEDAFNSIDEAEVEDKFDGVRAQVHVDAGRVKIFSRTMDDIGPAFPVLVESLSRVSRAIGGPAILDGEIVAWQPHSPRQMSLEVGAELPGRALPFSALQRRLGRKRVTPELVRAVPVAFVAFDVLYAPVEGPNTLEEQRISAEQNIAELPDGNSREGGRSRAREGRLVIDLPLRERRKLLERLLSGLSPAEKIEFPALGAPKSRQGDLFDPGSIVVVRGPDPNAVPSSEHPEGYDSGVVAISSNMVSLPPVLVSPSRRARGAEDLDRLFDAAQSRGNEGLMIKDFASAYVPGRRGRSWLKLKRELAMLDVVVTGVEWGNGKRARLLSDYTFAVSDGTRLLNIGKAYSGLTDKEITELTEWFQQHTLYDNGHFRTVQPLIVLEVAFNNVMVSDRHESGYALRFPRIIRLRPDKHVKDIDSLDRVREIYEIQHREKKAS